MSATDLIKKSILEQYGSVEIGIPLILVTMVLAGAIGIYIYFCYRIAMKNALYSRDFGISLIAISLITAGIVLTIQQNFVVSLGMVGALSIVRFRTAIKSPLELVFMFWAIGNGIMCGAGVADMALILSLFVSAVILIIEFSPTRSFPKMMMVSYENSSETEKKLYSTIKNHCKIFSVKTRSVVDNRIDIVAEIRTKNDIVLSNDISQLKGVKSVTIVEYDDAKSLL